MASNFFKLIAGLLPVLFGIWNNYSEKPAVKNLLENQEILDERIYRQNGHIRGLYVLIILLFVWNFILTAVLYLK